MNTLTIKRSGYENNKNKTEREEERGNNKSSLDTHIKIQIKVTETLTSILRIECSIYYDICI